MCENCDFVVPVNILTPFVHAPFSWATRHTTVCLNSGEYVASCTCIVIINPLTATTALWWLGLYTDFIGAL